MHLLVRLLYKHQRLISQCKRLHTTTHYLIHSRTHDYRWKCVDLEGQCIQFDVVVVGGGVAGLSTAIKLAELSRQKNINIDICLIEKSSYFGGHIISGACFQPAFLDQLLPDWKNKINNDVFTPVTISKASYLTKNLTIPIPLSKNSPLSNEGCSIISLGKLVKELSCVAQTLNVDLFNGFGVNEIIYSEDGSVVGVRLGDSGIHRDGSPKENFERGLAIRSRFTVIAEGCHGSLTKQIIRKFNLRKHSCPPSYCLGLKEIWEVNSKNHINGCVEHNIGYPLSNDTYGGSFVYHYIDNEPLVSLGLVIGLNYRNPYLNPYKELQRLKTHPKYHKLLEGGKRIGYGARTINKGGFQALPKLTFPGGCIVGCAGGLLNGGSLKGIHTAIGSGILAAEAIFQTLSSDSRKKRPIITNYDELMSKSWIWKELKSVRNFQPSFHTRLGMFGMMLYGGIVWPLTKGCEPITIKPSKHDHEYMQPAKYAAKINYSKPDNIITFDLLSSVALTNTNHEYDQPSHLILQNDLIPCDDSLVNFDGPEQRYCPAGVYEFEADPENDNKKILQINSQNCIHCKACDIKDPSQNITWVVPENGGGPNYFGL